MSREKTEEREAESTWMQCMYLAFSSRGGHAELCFVLLG